MVKGNHDHCLTIWAGFASLWAVLASLILFQVGETRPLFKGTVSLSHLVADVLGTELMKPGLSDRRNMSFR